MRPASGAEVCENRAHAPVVCDVGGKVELAQDVADMCLDSVRGQPETIGDAAIGQTFGHQAEDFSFSLRELVEWVWVATAADE